MNTDHSFNRRQLLAACTVFFLAPALRLVPGAAVRIAGRAAWVSVPLALPGILLYIWFVHSFFARRGDGEGMGELVQRALGRRAARAVLGLFAAWFLLYGSFMLRSGAERIVTTMYPNAGAELFIVTMGTLALIAALDCARTLVRAANLFLVTVLGVLFIVLFFALFSLERDNLLPVTVLDLPGTAEAALATLDVTVMPVYIVCFLPGLRRDASGGLRAGLMWGVGITALLTWLVTDIVGTFGAELTSRVTHPFFMLVKNLVFFKNLERMEALVVSLWVFSDFVVISTCLLAAQRCLRLMMGHRPPCGGEKMFSLQNGRWVIWLCAAGCVALALVIAQEPAVLDMWSRRIIPLANLAVALLLVPGVYIAGRIRKTL